MRRILIAEDDFTSRNVLTAVLKKSGFEVVETADGVEAWEALQKPDAPRLAILDWMMPQMDGLEVVRKVRSLETDQPQYLIMLTAKGDKTDIAAGLDAGADDYLAKPFERVELMARIRAGQRIVDLQNRLSAEATTDELTRLLNRRAGMAVLRREVARSARDGQRVGVGILDIDHFKRINDTYGHPTGDDVLRELAARLGATLRPYDHLSRYGGEEFLLVAPGGGEITFWKRFRAAIADTRFSTRSGELEVTVSIGWTSGNGTLNPEELIGQADQALYRAKEAGRNRVEGGNEEASPQRRATPPPLPDTTESPAPGLRRS